jgi:hypothetical protein
LVSGTAHHRCSASLEEDLEVIIVVCWPGHLLQLLTLLLPSNRGVRGSRLNRAAVRYVRPRVWFLLDLIFSLMVASHCDTFVFLRSARYLHGRDR